MATPKPLEKAKDHTVRPVALVILTVDDCAEDREMAAYALRNAGYRVLGVGDAQEAQRIAEERGDIDLLVTDFKMPGMNGVELARWFHSRFPLKKVLLVSSFPWEEIEPSLENTDWLAFLDKKGAFTQLAATVKRLLAETGEFWHSQEASSGINQFAASRGR